MKTIVSALTALSVLGLVAPPASLRRQISLGSAGPMALLSSSRGEADSRAPNRILGPRPGRA
jgi:hypothetical protein